MTSSQNFSEDAFFSAYKQLRNQFRKFYPDTIIEAALDYLKPAANSSDELQKQPWLVFLLIKWVLLDEQFNHRNKQNISKHEFSTLLEKMHGLGSKAVARMPNEYSHYRLWLRNVSYQQFFYQSAFNGPAFARQSLLFDKLPSNHSFRTEFLKATGVPLSDFFELSAILLARFMTDTNSSIDISWFSPITHRHNADVIQKFLDILSCDLPSLRKHLLEGNNSKIRKPSELFEETSFVKFPLLKACGQYHLWHPMIFNRGLEYFVYDTIRSSNPSGFMNKFGDLFESYVHRSIESLRLPYLVESQIQTLLPGTGKVTDFLITEDGANIFVDAKGVEIAYLGKVSHVPEVILDKVETSALKGIEQGFQIVRRLAEHGSLDHTFSASKENFLLIITLKELYLGSGTDFYEAAAKNKIDALIDNCASLPIPLENIYFLTIDDLDHLANCVNKGEVRFIDFIRQAVIRDRTTDSKLFHFRQHLAEVGLNIGLPKYLDEEIEGIFIRVEQLLQQSKDSS